MIQLGGTPIDVHTPPYLVAEISGNHRGSLETAKELIDAAATAGADAVKLQTYTPDTMTIRSQRPDFLIQSGVWAGSTLWDLYQSAHTPYEWHPELFAHAKERGITCFSTPFDQTAVDLLEALETPFYKLASFELTDEILIEAVAKTKKPLILSTGMAALEEIQAGVRCALDHGCKQVILLHCISAYPTPVEQANLYTIQALQEEFALPVGLSDHTLGTVAAVVATAFGAKVIEKHITLNRKSGGPDATFSLEPSEYAMLVRHVKEAHCALGTRGIHRQQAEEISRPFRRSVYAVADVAEGELFTEKNVRRIRPGYGLSPKYYREILGKKALKAIKRGTPIHFEHYLRTRI